MFPIPGFLPINFAINSLLVFILGLLVVPGVINFTNMALGQIFPFNLLADFFNTMSQSGMTM